ncbi:hypothetical protein Agabi119p4_9234 [Agaricus bisporus var. burnettii]|uniref:Uncharacterized protein n=1 Tax=Agaricus bisporus var. burnettii TaxID=192524 RepID=A0A8H7EY01_AGABI|nr:hypothetical protein Agabi119p4_9234 [Agaricus bisporus var. burnettii]
MNRGMTWQGSSITSICTANDNQNRTPATVIGSKFDSHPPISCLVLAIVNCQNISSQSNTVVERPVIQLGMCFSFDTC